MHYTALRSTFVLGLLCSCGTAPSSIGQGSELLTEEGALAKTSCAPAKALAYPGDQLLMRSNKKTAVWKASAGSVNDQRMFTAPDRVGHVVVTASDDQTSGECVIEVVPRPKVDPGNGAGAELSVHTSLGIPGPANSAEDHYLIEKDDYVVSYNAKRKTPNWVSWELNGLYVGGADRSNDWKSDSSIEIPQATEADYKKSGFDRGHMCPSADRSRNDDVNSHTFILTNAVPQVGAMNGGPWADLENHLRALAVSGKEIFIIAGGVWADEPATIGQGVAIPTATWKVAVVLEGLGDRAPDVSTSARTIAVMMPNDASVDQKDDWEKYQVTVRSIESATGYDFLSDLPRAIQDAIEN